jgi:hypothetical protein
MELEQLAEDGRDMFNGSILTFKRQPQAVANSKKGAPGAFPPSSGDLRAFDVTILQYRRRSHNVNRETPFDSPPCLNRTRINSTLIWPGFNRGKRVKI